MVASGRQVANQGSSAGQPLLTFHLVHPYFIPTIVYARLLARWIYGPTIVQLLYAYAMKALTLCCIL